jgi:hypothetical protein
MTRMRIITRTLTAAALLAATSCSSTVRAGSSPMFLVIDSLQGIAGGTTAGTPSATLFSDVLSLVASGSDSNGNSCQAPNPPCKVRFNDNGQAVLELAKKDVTSTTAPTTNNQVTITRIHIHYHPANGPVPADFDQSVTATVPATGTATVAFELVQSSAKAALGLDSGGQTSTAADVTFIGADQVGNAISVTGSIQIEFSNFAG